jgi:hypothetical protein
MRLFYLFLSITFFSVSLYSQNCPPPGFPNSGSNCGNPIICENLDDYCAEINNSNQPRNFPCCAGWQLNNDEWFGFFAGTTTITLEITPSNCDPGGQQGLQAAIYDNCPAFPPPGGWCTDNLMDAQCACTEDPFQLTATDFVVGEVYWLVIDGCSGNVCDYVIQVLEGSTVGFPPDDPGVVTGPTPVCQGTAADYNVPPISGATIYTWTLSPSNAGTLSNNNNNGDITVTWATGFSGTATLCVKTSNQCFSNPDESCITVTVIPKPTATISGGGTICTNSGGSVNLTVTLTGEPDWEFVYAINGVPQPAIITSSSPYTIIATQSGNYTLVSVNSIDSDPDCAGTVSGTATVTAITLNPSSIVVSAVCGQSNGSVDLSVTGGNAPYSYSWSGGQTTQDLSNVSPGAYTVTITDNNSCTATHTATVNDNIVNPTLSAIITNNTSCANDNGAIDLSVSPAGSYNYSWSNGATTQDLSNLAGGTYMVTVTQGLSCSASATYIVNDVPNAPNPTATPTNSSCDLPNGSINASVSGGVAPYTFEWSNGATTEDLANIIAGTYELTVTGANNCTNTISVAVNNVNPAINLSGVVINNTTCNGGNGSINLMVTPANNYTYEWSNGATTEDISSLPPGAYTVTVSAGGSCTAEASYTVNDAPNLPNPTAVATPSTCDLANGSINASVSGGVAPYTFEWSNGETTEDISDILAGNYTLTVTGNNGCTKSVSVTVGNNNPSFNLSANIVNNTTCNGGNGSINLTVTPSGSYTYSWSNGATTEDISDLLAGNYSVTVTTGISCSEEATFTVNDASNAPSPSAVTTPSTCDLENGSINASVTGGVAPYTFEWSNGATTEDISDLLAGNYTLTVTGSNGCTNTVSAVVGNNNPNFNLLGSIIHNTACNGGNGSINLIVTPPDNYTFEWSNGATTEDIFDLPAGPYTVTVSAGGSCTKEETFTVNGGPNLPSLSAISTPSTCGLENGSINASVTGGGTPYNFEWSNGATTEDLSNISGGTYILTVTDANGCTSSLSVDVANLNSNFSLSATIVHNSSCSGGNGSINLTVTPSGNYMYIWSNGSTVEDLSGLPAGSYSVTVTENACVEEATFVVNNTANLPNPTAAPTPTSCNMNNGSIDASVTGGVSPYTYQWSNGATTEDLNNLPTGNYVLTVTGANGCTNTTSANITTSNPPLVASIQSFTNVSCFGGSNGTATALGSGGNGVFSYQWSNGATTASITNLMIGTYVVTVTDGANCTASASVNISQPNPLLPNASATGETAFNANDGTATANPSGGTAGYTYNWSNGSTAQTITNLSPGTYTVSVTDTNGCITIQSVTVNAFGCSLMASASATNVSCFGYNDGLASVNLTGGTNPVTYTWSNGATTQSVNNLAPGFYTVNVLDGNNCPAMLSLVISEPPQLLANASATDPTANGANDGTATASPTGGNPGYQYLWSTGSTAQSITNLSPGSYTVSVTDAMGCSVVQTVTVNEYGCSLMASIASTNLTCYGTNNGSATVSISGESDPVTYTWSNGATTQTVTGLLAGTYTVTVVDGNNCIVLLNVTISEPPVLLANVTATGISDHGASDGTATANPTGGTPGYSYLWSNAATTQTITGLTPGTYTVVVTDANGCTKMQTAYVSAFNCSLSAIISRTHVRCFGGADGQANIEMQGGTSPYTYLWSNGETAESISQLSAGLYSVTAADAAGCFSFITFSINQPTILDAIIVNIENVLCPQDMTGSADIVATGGISPYNFYWSGGSAENLGVGSYIVTVTDANACTKTTSFSIVATDSLPPSITCPADLQVCGASIVDYPKAFAQDNCGLAESPVVISGPASGSFMEEGVHIIVFQATDASGNATTCSFSIEVYEAPTILIDSIGHDMNGQGVGLISITVVGNGSYSYSWTKDGQPYAITEDLAGLKAGLYSLILIDSNGCTATIDPIVISNYVGTNEPEQNGWVRLKPNPAQSYIQMEIYGLEVISATILDMRGGMIGSILTSDLLSKIDIQQLPAATYCLKITTGSGRVLSLKFVKT